MVNKHIQSEKASLRLCIIFCGFVLAVAATQVRTFSQPNPEELLRECALAMSAPVQFHVVCKTVHVKSKKEGVNGQIDVIVDKILVAGESVLRTESLFSKITMINLVRIDSCFELFPQTQLALDTTFRRTETLSGLWQMTDVAGSVLDVKLSEENGTWRFTFTENDRRIELLVNSATKFMLKKSIRSLNTNVIEREYFYSHWTKTPSHKSEHFDIPANYSRRVAANQKDYAKTLASTFDKITPVEKRVTPKIVLKKSTKSGLLIEDPPTGVSREEAAKRRSEAILKAKLPLGMTEDQRKELAEKWATNVSLDPGDIVLSVKPKMASRNYSLTLILAVVVLCTVSICIAIRLSRGHVF